MNNTLIPERFTCEGKNSSPPLMFEEIPKETRSLALVVTDPDAQSGDFVHWIIWNISPESLSFEEGSVPNEAIEGQNDFGTYGYGGPCPPSGMHRYEFRLYALDGYINLKQTSNKTDLLSHMGGTILDEAVLVGLYARRE